MKKIIVSLIILILVAGTIIFMISSWRSGTLYWRVSSATITTNGVVSNESQLYRSRTGEYFIFTKDGNNRPRTYVVIDGPEPVVGIPAAGVPSTSTKSIKTSYFLLCLHCPIVAAGTEKYDQNAKVAVSSNEISFKIYDSTVVAKF